jgi:ribosomal protein L14E/L6E/L27E
MKILLSFIMAFLIIGCGLNEPKYKKKPSNKLKLANEIKDEQLANEITLKVANQLKEKYNLIPCGSGGQMMYEIKMLALSFDYYGPIDIEKGRELLLAAINEFKDTVNADERIRSYLFNYPFEAKNIEIRIFLYNLDGSVCDSDKLVVIKSIDGNFIYNIDGPDESSYITIHKETYEEAMQKIEDKSKGQAKEDILESA